MNSLSAIKTLKFVAAIHKSDDTAYWITAPDAPGCMVCGGSVNDAIVSFHQALALHIDGLMADDRPLPVPRDEQAVLAVIGDPPLKTVMIEIAVPA